MLPAVPHAGLLVRTHSLLSPGHPPLPRSRLLLAPHAQHVPAVPDPAHSSFRISCVMQWPKPPCNPVLGLPGGTAGVGL